MVKQYIVVRKDLKMRSGKVASQVSHASMAALLNSFKYYKINNINRYEFNDNTFVDYWLKNSFTKIILSVNSDDELLQIYNEIVKINNDKVKFIPISLIQDNGTTVFDGIKTNTCIGIGPIDADDVVDILGNLKLF